MRNSLLKGAALAIAAGALLLSATPASATTAAEPYSSFDVKVKASKTVKPGGEITYTIKATNKGPHYADSWFVGGQFPKGVDLRRIEYWAEKGTQCALDGRAFYCVLPRVVEVDEAITMRFEAKVTKKAKGTQTATLGVVTYNVDQGMENMSKEELDRLGIPEYAFAKTVKTKVVR
ncbi:DUF11 domain-containing protein [Nonomuraea gerenzanensis]|uniref:DUF11 domain-containing protein n=1 Tax=Nonomuraea gerenzanensis TaxID=93944 RepID=A0A1M4DY54_9ACTN|nr:DUF11 domain-containing protein [Nonomuraea gerenzanensis]UBU13819.1 DUF11 domain-containing protein [Nonomuraea gerenzanensis]SBO91494.1 hypothetical protein BN4615_P1008 [Nonomuraea gerenzanensis]